MAFWGLVLEPKKSYTQREVEQPFHISMAALDLQNCDPNESVSVVCRKRDSDFILCSLSKKHNVFNVPLNLDFELGGEINFHVLGNSVVHLTGYMIEDMESFEESDDSMGEEEEDESEVSSKDLFKNTKKMLEAAGKRKQDANAQNKSKKVKLEAGATAEEDDEDEDDSDFDMADSDDEDLEEEEEEDDDDDDDDDDDEEDDEAAQLVQKLEASKKDKSKQGGKQNNQQVKASPKTEQKQSKKDKKDQAKPTPTPTKAANGSPAQANGAPKKQVLQGGVQIEELRVGNGPVAKSGKMVSVYYVGRLKQNNKQFDASTSGPGFQFRLGKGEVISGWDVGVAGMKVGGKRRLTIPAKMGYGAKGAGREIPPNSTLVFEVELKNVK